MDQRSLPCQKVPISLHTSFPENNLPPDLRTALQNALLTPNSRSSTSPPQSAIPKIQLALSAALQESGWNQKVEAYILRLVRSKTFGSHTRPNSDAEFSEIMAQVMDESRSRNIQNSPSGGEEQSGIQVDETVIQAGIKALRRELNHISEVVEVDD